MIENFKEIEFTKSNFLTPKRVQYVENGKEKIWDAVESHDSVSILIFNTDKNAYVIVKQFRPPVKLAHPEYTGYIYELCSGIVDKDKSLKQIAIEECLEECGYAVQENNIQEITTVHSMVGIIGAEQHWFVATVTDKDKVEKGGGIEDESIEVVYLDRESDEFSEFIRDNTACKKTAGLMAQMLWFEDSLLFNEYLKVLENK